MQSHASAAAQHELATEHGVHAGDTDEALAMALPRSLANQHAKRRPLAVVEDNVTVRDFSDSRTPPDNMHTRTHTAQISHMLDEDRRMLRDNTTALTGDHRDQLQRNILALESELRYHIAAEEQWKRAHMSKQLPEIPKTTKTTTTTLSTPSTYAVKRKHARKPSATLARKPCTTWNRISAEIMRAVDSYESDPSPLTEALQRRPHVHYDAYGVSDGELTCAAGARRRLLRKKPVHTKKHVPSHKHTVKQTRDFIASRQRKVTPAKPLDMKQPLASSTGPVKERIEYVETAESGYGLLVDAEKLAERGIYVQREPPEAIEMERRGVSPHPVEQRQTAVNPTKPATSQQRPRNNLASLPAITRPPLNHVSRDGHPMMASAKGAGVRGTGAGYQPLRGDSQSSLLSGHTSHSSAPDVEAQRLPVPPYSTKQILGEERKCPPANRSKDKSIIDRFKEAARTDPQEVLVKYESQRARWWTRTFRFLNLFRAMVTTSYGMYIIYTQWNNPTYLELGAKAFTTASLIFLCIDMLFAIIKAFPRIFWVFWDVDTWDPFVRSFSIWNLVADHQMLLDISPILANVILKIYGFRLGELLASNNATALDGQPLKMIGITSTVREVNFFMLLLFGTTLFITILLHSTRLARTLVLEKHAYTLATLVLEKIACVLFDLLTNSFLLYQVLVWRQERMFELDLTMNLLLAVFAVSPVISLTTNALLNLPLHYKHMRMQLHARHLASGERGRDIPRSRVLLAALRKTFHPLIVSIFGVYAAFSTAALCYILWVVYHVDYRSVLDVPSAFQSGYIPTSTNSTSPVDLQSYVMWLESATDTRETLLTMLWLNIVINYAAGVVTAMSYWAWRMFGGLWRISRSAERRGAVRL